MSDKSQWAYRTISEVSEQLDVPAHVLRFWETKFTQLKPMKRSGGRRYYKASDLELLTRIRDLLYRDGFTIKGAQKALREKKAHTTEVVEAIQSADADGSGQQEIIANTIQKLKQLEVRLEALIATRQ